MTRALVAVVLLCAVVWPRSAAADGPPDGLANYAVTTWSEKEGLPAGRIRALEQDAEGYLWIGTETGLVRFDGVRFTQWGVGKLPMGIVLSLHSARDHSLWVGMGGPTSIARLHDGAFTLYGAADGLPNALVVALYEDRAGTIWAGTWPLRSPRSMRRRCPAIDASPPCTAGSCKARRSISARIGHDPLRPWIRVRSIPSGFTSPVTSGITRA